MAGNDAIATNYKKTIKCLNEQLEEQTKELESLYDAHQSLIALLEAKAEKQGAPQWLRELLADFTNTDEEDHAQ